MSGERRWNATLLEGPLEESVPRLKDGVEGDLFMHGSGDFAYALATNRRPGTVRMELEI